MKDIYLVELRTDIGSANTSVEAESVDEAFALAAAIDPTKIDFEPYSEHGPVNMIIVTDPDDNEWTWQSDELKAWLAAGDLLIAAKNLLTALELAPEANRDNRVTRSCIRQLERAVARAEGRQP